MPSFSSVPPNPIPGVSFTITELEDALSSLQTATSQERMMYSYTSYTCHLLDIEKNNRWIQTDCRTGKCC